MQIGIYACCIKKPTQNKVRIFCWTNSGMFSSILTYYTSAFFRFELSDLNAYIGGSVEERFSRMSEVYTQL